MNKIFKLALGCFVGMALMVSCSDDEENLIAFQIDKNDITLGAEGGDEIVVVKSGSEWVAESSSPWIMISPANGVGTTECRIVVDSTLVNDVRTASVRFSPKGQVPQIIKVHQTGFDKAISLSSEIVEIKASAKKTKRFFEIEATTNVQFKLELKDDKGQTIDWLETKDTKVNLDRGARPRTVKMRFDWRMNTEPEGRIAKVNFVPADENETLAHPTVLTVNQQAAPKIEDTRAGDSLTLVILQEKMGITAGKWNLSENMRNWEGIELWEEGDTHIVYTDAASKGEEKEVPAEFVGRVRSVRFYMINIDEPLPVEFGNLKYLETLNVMSNPNNFLKSLDLGTSLCDLKNLKALRVYSYGLVSLPDEFVKLGASLEALDLAANNFSEIPDILTPENFPHLTYLDLAANRRWESCRDLRNKDSYDNGIGLNLKVRSSGRNRLRDLFLWENLEFLSLANNYIEGQLPDFTVGREGVQAYTQDDVNTFGGDTLQNLVDKKINGKFIPKILPNARMVKLNLNFFTQKVPDWILYHPHFIEWDPAILLFNQQEKGLDSYGKLVGFDNEITDYEYYFQFYPRLREKFEFNDMKNEETK